LLPLLLGRAPLHLAAANGNVDTIKLLLSYKDTGWFADGHATPLHLAAKFGNTEAVELITQMKGHAWHTERATSGNAINRIKDAVGGKSDKRLEDFFDRKTFSARELAVLYGHQTTALAFPISSNDFLEAFSCACMLGDMDMAEALWNHHEARYRFQKYSSLKVQVLGFPAPPLHLAVMSGSRAMVAFLLEKGFEVTKKSKKSKTGLQPYSSPAHYAAVVGSTELLLMLERRGADLTALDFLYRTPLSYAVGNLNEDAVELLSKRKYKERRGWFQTAKSAWMPTYLGKGHVLDNSDSTTVKRNVRIQKAMKSLGLETSSTSRKRTEL
jgi:ankyrin repeat protein